MKKKKIIVALLAVLVLIAGIAVYSTQSNTNKSNKEEQKEELPAYTTNKEAVALESTITNYKTTFESQVKNTNDSIQASIVVKHNYILASSLSSDDQAIIDNWIDTHITNDMSTMDKVYQVINYVINMPYNYDYWSCHDMLIHGQGECWGATDVILHILERLGIPVGIRTRANTLAYPDYHIENYVVIDGVTYDLNCGKNTAVPRVYIFQPITSYYKYSVKADGTIVITDFDNYCQNVTVPSTIDGYTVSEIAANAYANHFEMVSVTIPNNITVDTYAFKQCTSLSTVNIYSNTTIQENAFYTEAATYLGDDLLWIPQGITNKTINVIG